MATILIIDDDEHVRYLLKSLLETMGHQIVEATNGREALTAVQSYMPSLVIVDIFMPEMDGIELIRNARGIQQDLQIIAISGSFSSHEVDVLETAKRLGAAYTLQKPFEIPTLVNLVQRLLSTESART